MTAIIDEGEWGPPISHNPHPYVCADGTIVEAVCPFPAEIGLVFFDGRWSEPVHLSMLGWYEHPMKFSIVAYRLRADHHAYGPRASRMDRQPDQWSNAYDCDSMIHRGADWDWRQEADNHTDEDMARASRIGIWRIFHKCMRPSELIVLPDRGAAEASGLRAGCQDHAGLPHVECWYPSLGLFWLSRRPWQRVTIDRSVPDSTPEGSLRAILRNRQQVWGNKAIWLEIGSPPISAKPRTSSLTMVGRDPGRPSQRRARIIMSDEVDHFAD